MSVTPDFIGQVYKDTNTGNIWRANSLTPGDWTLEVIAKQWTFVAGLLDSDFFINGMDVTSISMPGVSSSGSNAAIDISGSNSLVSVSFPHMTSMEGTWDIYDSPALTTLDLSAVTVLSPSSSLVLTIANTATALSSIDLTSLQTVEICTINITGIPIDSLLLPALTAWNAPAMYILNCSSLVTFSIPQVIFGLPVDIDLSGNALNAASVNQVLARAVASPLFTGAGGIINLSGGTSSAPSGQGIADKATMIGRGCTVTTN